MEGPLKEPTVIDAPPGKVLLLLSGFWAGWGTVFFLALASEPERIRLFAATVVGLIFAFFSLCIFLIGYTKWHRPMTNEERAEWEKENAKKATAIRTACEERERRLEQERQRLHQTKERTTRLIAEMEANPTIAQILRDARRRASKEAGEQLLANANIAIAGLGAWLTDRGVPNRLPGDLFASFAKGKIGEHFSSLSPEERAALQKYLPRVARVLEEALEVWDSKRAVKEILLPLFFGET